MMKLTEAEKAFCLYRNGDEEPSPEGAMEDLQEIDLSRIDEEITDRECLKSLLFEREGFIEGYKRGYQAGLKAQEGRV